MLQLVKMSDTEILNGAFIAPGEHVFNTSTGRVLQYFVHGRGPLVLVLPPAWGLHSRYLQTGLAPLAETFTVIYLELRANNKSTRPTPGEMTSWHMADDVEELRKYLVIEKFARLIGHSNGGTIALWYSIRYPGSVGTMVLINHQLEGFNDSTTMQEIRARRLLDSDSHPAIEALESDWGSVSNREFGIIVRTFSPIYFAKPPKNLSEILALFPVDIPVWNYLTLFGAAGKSNMLEQELELSKVRAKTFMVSGREDMICTPAQAFATQKGIVGSSVIVYETCAHFPWIENRSQFFHDLLRFMND